MGTANLIMAVGEERKPALLPMEGRDAAGNLYQADSIGFLKNGKRFFPIMGEFHYSRWERDTWEQELLKMKAGGLQITATYVFWIHHEEKKGEWDFSGCRDLRAFLETCQRCGMQVWLRIGPWAHGECRNGGFPDWLVEECGDRIRSNDSLYLKEVARFYHEIGVRVRGMMVKDGGPVLGIQLENEYGHCGGGPATLKECREHLLMLKRMALEEGMEVPYYTSTGWGGGVVVDGETLPVLGGYVDAPWAGHVQEMPASANFLFGSYKQDENIGSDLKREESRRFTFDPGKNPYLTAELGGGMQVTSHRRIYPWPEDILAQTVCMLGGGANLLGYYMYHGGINPDGKYTTLQESRATGYSNDLPVKSYDFETCIRQSGEINASFGKLKRLHLLLNSFGEELACTLPYFPEKQPDSPEDMETLRIAARLDKKMGLGFLFVNNHQRKRMMVSHEEETVIVEMGEEGGTVMLEHLAVQDGECQILPFRFGKGGSCETRVLPKRTNASLLCKIGKRIFFYSDMEHPFFEWEGEPGNFVVLTGEEADRAFLIGNRLYLTQRPDSCLIEKDGGIYLISKAEQETLIVYGETGNAETICVRNRPVLCPVSAELLREETESCGAVAWKEYLIRVEWEKTGARRETALQQLYLKTDYAGDRAEVYINGQLVDDWFTTGEQWHMALKRFGWPTELVLRIYPSDRPMPNPYGNQVYYDLPAKEGCSLFSVETEAEYCTKVG